MGVTSVNVIMPDFSFVPALPALLQTLHYWHGFCGVGGTSVCQFYDVHVVLFVPALPALLQTLRYWHGFCGVGGTSVCQFQAFLSHFLAFTSMLLVFTMSIERFCAFKRPFKYDQIFSKSKFAVIVIAIVLYSVSIRVSK